MLDLGLARERKERTLEKECVEVSGRAWVSQARLLKSVAVLGHLGRSCSSAWVSLGLLGYRAQVCGRPWALGGVGAIP